MSCHLLDDFRVISHTTAAFSAEIIEADAIIEVGVMEGNFFDAYPSTSAYQNNAP